MIAERAARNERVVTVAALGLIVAISLYAMIHTGDVLMMSPASAQYSFANLILMFAMWWTMMLAMMLPSAAPAILLFGALSRKRAVAAGPAVPAAVFASGYAIVWATFSIAAVALQFLLERFVPFDGMMEAQSVRLGGVLLIIAGIYQLTPWKYDCLRRCQSPLMYFANNWQSGTRGALWMGIHHGLYCAGCCAVLMGLLFYGGVMDLWWIAGLAVYVLVEKLVVRGPLLSKLSGAGLIAWGAVVLWSTA